MVTKKTKNSKIRNTVFRFFNVVIYPEEHQKEKETREKMAESARQEQTAQANRSNYRGAIIGIIFTVIIAFMGISTYASGRGYMTFFGIELSPVGFALLIVAFLVWDIVAIVNAKKKL